MADQPLQRAAGLAGHRPQAARRRRRRRLRLAGGPGRRRGAGAAVRPQPGARVGDTL